MTRGRHGGTGNPGQMLQRRIDSIASAPPVIRQGVYTLQGNQISVIKNLNNTSGSSQMAMFQPQQQTYQNPLQLYQLPMSEFSPPRQIKGGDQPIKEARITVVGTKTSASNTCCCFLTVLLGSCLIFPLFFMCCMWWKSIMYPKYEVNPEFYRALGRFLKKEKQCRVLNLTVVDNAFDTAKARLLYESLQGTAITGMNFENSALQCNYLGSEADDFHGNMMAIKNLSIASTIKWGSIRL